MMADYIALLISVLALILTIVGAARARHWMKVAIAERKRAEEIRDGMNPSRIPRQRPPSE